MAVDKPLTDFFGARAVQDAVDGSITFFPQDLSSNATPPRWTPLSGIGPHTAEGIILSLLLRLGERQDTSTDAQVALAGPDISLSSRSVDGVIKAALVYLFSIQIVNVIEGMMPDPSKV